MNEKIAMLTAEVGETKTKVDELIAAFQAGGGNGSGLTAEDSAALDAANSDLEAVQASIAAVLDGAAAEPIVEPVIEPEPVFTEPVAEEPAGETFPQ